MINVNQNLGAIPGINNTNSLNYVSGNTVYIFDSLSPSTVAPLMADITSLIYSLSYKIKETQPFDLNQKVIDPYAISPDVPLIDFVINSPGGQDSCFLSLHGMISLAKKNGIIVRTNVFGTAASNASKLAVIGTPKFRVMSEDSLHFVHYGSCSTNITNESEIKKAAFKADHKLQTQIKTYLLNTKTTKAELSDLMSNEMGYVTAKEAKRMGFCDFILMNSGKIH